ncbi:hypothetical protein VTO42DRAFT_1597 [Malbranchea cinnamomea]
MAPPQSNEGWESLFCKVNDALQPTNLSKYPAPEPSRVPQFIDHTLLALSATEDQIDALCNEAREHSFAAVCVRLNYVERAVNNLKGTSVSVACTVGFHEGTYSTEEKVAEAKAAVQKGAAELDMVMNYVFLKEKKYTSVYEDIHAVRKAAGPSEKVVLKVIIETSQLSRDEIIAASVLSCLAGADYVKTSTGFNGPGANVENVALMRAVCDEVKPAVKVKASGGVRTGEDCIKMIQAGAGRIGASAGVKIVQELAGGDADQQKGLEAEGY